MIFPKLSITGIVEPCSVDAESRLVAVREKVEAVEQKASETQTLLERIRSETAAIDVATRTETALHRLARDTHREHRAQEQKLESDVVSVERQLEAMRGDVEGDTLATERRCRDVRDQIGAGGNAAAHLSLSVQTISASQQRMETLRDEGGGILDRLRAIARRQQSEQST
ncbi:hypothetical protein [Schlesneria sp. DSM 10557]|uniref:hypothetical protein n=1 Tax=Schlesneria sp. DSM 10557 TaxID=3044399 RepID=UPI0035A06DE2